MKRLHALLALVDFTASNKKNCIITSHLPIKNSEFFLLDLLRLKYMTLKKIEGC
jgi:hypothetical protein